MNKIKTLFAAGLIGVMSIAGACKWPVNQHYVWRGPVPASQGYIADCMVNNANEAKTGSEVKIYDLGIDRTHTGMIIATDLDGDFAPDIVNYNSISKDDSRMEWSATKLTEIVTQAVAEAKRDYQMRK